MKTRITELFGIEHPIIQGGMHYVGLAPLAAQEERPAGTARPQHSKTSTNDFMACSVSGIRLHSRTAPLNLR